MKAPKKSKKGPGSPVKKRPGPKLMGKPAGARPAKRNK